MPESNDLYSKIEKQLELAIREKFSSAESDLITKFMSQYFLSISYEDLSSKDLEEIFGILISHWKLIKHKLSDDLQLKISNPKIEDDGWDCAHTIIEMNVTYKPFLVDSIRILLQKLEIKILNIININEFKVKRNADGEIVQIFDLDYLSETDNYLCEHPIYIEIERQSDLDIHEHIKNKIVTIINDVDIVVRDWKSMQVKAFDCLKYLQQLQQKDIVHNELDDIVAFIQWIAHNHFTFLGFAQYEYIESDKKELKYIQGSGLGMLRDSRITSFTRSMCEMSNNSQRLYYSKYILMLGKTNTISTIHRPAYTDFISIKIFDDHGNFKGEYKFIGLYTAAAYNLNTKDIPYINKKVDAALAMSKFPANSHDSRALLNIIDNLPRDDIIHGTAEEIYKLGLNILYMKERQKIRFFMRKDLFGRYFSCLTYIPREIFSSKLRRNIQKFLIERLNGYDGHFSTTFSESILARIHFIIRVNPLAEHNVDVKEIEQELLLISKTWEDNLYEALLEKLGEGAGIENYKKYVEGIPASYKENFAPSVAVVDLINLNKLNKEFSLNLILYRNLQDSDTVVRLKVLRYIDEVTLSEVIPMLENMGLTVLTEKPYKINAIDDSSYCVNDYKLEHKQLKSIQIDEIKHNFKNCFTAVWFNKINNDGFNKLIINTGITWAEAKVFRAYYNYLWQICSSFSYNYVVHVLNNNYEITKLLLKVFYIKFEPNEHGLTYRFNEVAKVKLEIFNKLNDVKSLNEDRVIRSFLDVIENTLRTNFFQKDDKGENKTYFSFKIDSAKLENLPLPRPMFEIFVFSKHTEGIHLRTNTIARGGIRWSDRHEDYRTEVLGLMKAQQVKNSVIVPAGAKGGFIVKQNLFGLERAKVMELVQNSYKTFIRGLLDITDNHDNSDLTKSIFPKDVIVWDNYDPYLVVAADKGTASFSDIANSISKEYNFWLGDAFASGGSQGYDHKQMGITAKGAFESVKLHFQALGHDVMQKPFRVIGIGDMGGDVFGNGMLLSNQIKLLAAFNHVNIFIDPNPCIVKSYAERLRLFNIEGSGWEDYDKSLISNGGGVFRRSSKNIPLSKEIQTMLGCQEDSLEPNLLIKAILTMEADLFWNGGIGTFVKASLESNQDVSDRTNDNIRINGSELQVKVVAEGGNLGFTQLARIEFASNGGIVNNDAIDNSAGVNCSDVEVNIKLLLNQVIENGEITAKQRNELLATMEQDVAFKVLTNNQSQNEALSIASYKANNNIEMHSHLLDELERTANLNRKIEYLPSKEEIQERKLKGLGFTRPELAVMMAYSKIKLKEELLLSNIAELDFTQVRLINYFPKVLLQKYKKYILEHSLKKQIISTSLANKIIDKMGLSFIFRLYDETGASTQEIVAAFLVACEVVDADYFRDEIRALGHEVENSVVIQLNNILNRLVRRTARWFLRNYRHGINIDCTILRFKAKFSDIQQHIYDLVGKYELKKMQENKDFFMQCKVAPQIANQMSSMHVMLCALEIIDASIAKDTDHLLMAKLYFAVGNHLKLDWLKELILRQPVVNNWDSLARAAFIDDVDRQQRTITLKLLESDNYIITADKVYEAVEIWKKNNLVIVERWLYFINELENSTLEFTMFAVALRELLNLSQSIL